ncbi:MAG: glycosyltransferase family 4 protein [Actinomycetota bacterium]|nr:glycosyltransferase family 4 protein [Actinomycetota bacterium]
MRVAHVTDFYLPRLGGIEMHVADLSERQQRRGHEVHVITSSPAAGPCPRGSSVPVHRVTSHFKRPHALHPLSVREGVAALVRLRPDVVHAHLGVASPLAFFVARAAAQRGIPTVVTVHSMWAGVRPIMRTMDFLGRWSRLPILWTAVSRAAAGPVAAVLPAGTTIHVLANGIDQDQWRLASPPPPPDGELVLAAVMRLARRKRPMALLAIVRDAQAELERVGDPTRLRLVVAGDGPREGVMTTWLARHGMTSSVDLLGRVDRRTVHDEVLGRAHAFLAPADLESFGIAALEARCAGIPVLAKSGGGMGEFIHHEAEGLLCDTDADMSAAIVRLVLEPGLRARIAAHNREATCAVAWESLLLATEAAYDLATRQAHGDRQIPEADLRVPLVR